VEKRKRWCHQPPSPGEKYCPSHLNEVSGRRRIPCPLDSKHTCYEHKLEQHLVKCPTARRRADLEAAPYYRRNINLHACLQALAFPSSAGGQVLPEGQPAPSIFATTRTEDIEALVAIVRAAHARLCTAPLEMVVLRHPACEPFFSPSKGWVYTSSLLQHILWQRIPLMLALAHLPFLYYRFCFLKKEAAI